jgi:peptide/nickel transport system ATP-binding protein
VIEMGSTDDIISRPVHPYTKGLIGSLPGRSEGKTRLEQIPGMMPNLTHIPKGCAFHPRCNLKEEICRKEVPHLIENKTGKRFIACHVCNRD